MASLSALEGAMERAEEAVALLPLAMRFLMVATRFIVGSC